MFAFAPELICAVAEVHGGLRFLVVFLARVLRFLNAVLYGVGDAGDFHVFEYLDFVVLVVHVFGPGSGVGGVGAGVVGGGGGRG